METVKRLTKKNLTKMCTQVLKEAKRRCQILLYCILKNPEGAGHTSLDTWPLIFSFYIAVTCRTRTYSSVTQIHTYIHKCGTRS